MIETTACEAHRWARVHSRYRYALGLHRISKSDIRIVDSTFKLAKKSGQPLPFGEATPTYKDLQEACRQSAEEGYHCFDDMFVWASDFLDRHPEVIPIIRDRFPLLFIDEAQDLTMLQSAILRRIFLDGEGPVLRQRLGDCNQAIFDEAEDAEEAAADRFPENSAKKDLPSSHRFGQAIADLAAPLGVEPQRLVGRGPKPLDGHVIQGGKHTVFLFDDNSAFKVLDAYGKKLVDVFSDKALREGVFTAVGQVHRPPEDSDPKKSPYSIGYYWPEYDWQLSKRDPMPSTLVQYIRLGHSKAKSTGEAHSAVDKIAQGVLRFVGLATGQMVMPHSGQYHGRILRLLESHPHLRTEYEDLVLGHIVQGLPLEREAWEYSWRGLVRAIAEAIAGKSLSIPEADPFLAWAAEPDRGSADNQGFWRGDNVFRYPRDNPRVYIRVGSIHSVKGETHLATLVCETYWYDHNLENLKPWLIGEKEGWKEKDGLRQSYRLKVHYVAMTRPTHLLCLAMKRASFEAEPGQLDKVAIAALEQRGWAIELVSPD